MSCRTPFISINEGLQRGELAWRVPRASATALPESAEALEVRGALDEDAAARGAREAAHGHHGVAAQVEIESSS
jgi:hypothetical protein